MLPAAFPLSLLFGPPPTGTLSLDTDHPNPYPIGLAWSHGPAVEDLVVVGDSTSPYTLPVPLPGLYVALTSHHLGAPGKGGALQESLGSSSCCDLLGRRETHVQSCGWGGGGHKAGAPGSLPLVLLRLKASPPIHLLGPVSVHFTGEEPEAGGELRSGFRFFFQTWLFRKGKCSCKMGHQR